MRFGSVCSGIEAASVAWAPLGWKAAWFSEIEPFPCAVLKHHYPMVPNLGDMTALPHRILSGEIEAPDMLCGGTPCQAFSVAGLRNSLDDHRGNLTLTFVEIANAIDQRRSVQQSDPVIIFWENVPGVLNTKDNAFGCFLAGLAGEDDPLIPSGGRWTNAGFVDGPQRAVAWRVLDAQYFGVAQRRRRVFVVASARDDFDPAAVLFEFDGVRRDTAPGRETGQEIARCVTAGTGQRYDAETETIIPIHDKATRHAGHSQDRKNADGSGNGLGVGAGGDPMYTITTGDKHAVAQPIMAFKPGQSVAAGAHAPAIAFSAKDHGADATEDLSPTLRAMPHHGSHANGGGQMGVAYGFQPRIARNGRGDMGDKVNALTSQAGETGKGDAAPCVAQSMAVRRLTPTECERLQGFPDGYTNIPWRGKSESPDGPRYKALGNSWAVPVVRWIGERISRAI